MPARARPALVQTVEQKEKSEKPPALYDLTTLQRDANRQLGYTAQQTLDYLQALYEKKLCTYPRTDSRYLTADMEGTVPALTAAAAKICGVAVPDTVSGRPGLQQRQSHRPPCHRPHRGSWPGRMWRPCLPGNGKSCVWWRGSFCAPPAPLTAIRKRPVTLDCGGNQFSVKGKAIADPGWKAYQRKRQTRQKKASCRTD